MNKKLFIYISLGIGVILVVLLSIISINSSQKSLVWFDARKLFDEFEYKKSLQEDYKKVLKSREKILDSLSRELSLMIQQGKQSGKDFEQRKALFVQTKDQFIQDNSTLRDQFDDKIFNQLKQYIKEFGEEKKIEVLLSINPDEDLMYASNKADVTLDLIKFCNQRHKGAKP